MSTQNAVTTKGTPSPMQSVRQAFEQMKGQFAMALPKHITPDRMVRVALTAIQNTPKLLDCDRQSLYSAVMRAAQLGLEPDGVLGQAYLIPYGNTVQFIPGYKGLIDLARRTGEVSNIIAKEVYANDHFTIDWSKEIPFEHRPCMDGERGEVKYFWALARFKDGGFHWDYMTRQEVEGIRDNSNGYKAAVAWSKNPKNTKKQGVIESPWESNFMEMAKKTVIRRIAKYLPMSVQRAVIAEDLMEAGKKFTADEYGEIIIEGDVVDDGNNPAGNDNPPAKKTAKLDNFAGDTKTPKKPEAIKVPLMADDKTQFDWELYSQRIGVAISEAPDSDYIARLIKLNESPLANLRKQREDLYAGIQNIIDTTEQLLEGRKEVA